MRASNSNLNSSFFKKNFGFKLILPILVGAMAVLVKRLLIIHAKTKTIHTEDDHYNTSFVQKQQTMPLTSMLTTFAIASSLTLLIIIIIDYRHNKGDDASINDRIISSSKTPLLSVNQETSSEISHEDPKSTLIEDMMQYADTSGKVPF